jgi:hypothetical protein
MAHHESAYTCVEDFHLFEVGLNSAGYAGGLTLEPFIILVGWVNPHLLKSGVSPARLRVVEVTSDFRPEGHCFLLPVHR